MISCSIDWEREGRQVGSIDIPHSTNDSAWQKIRIPIFLFKRGSGPATLMLGGSHGDEYEGPIALSKLAHGLDIDSFAGTLILVPAINLPAVMTGTRLSPLDGKNLNREFPGLRRGSVTQQIADFISNQLVPRVDTVMDVHSGGRSLRFLPCMLVHDSDDPQIRQRTLNAAKAVAAPLTVVIREPHAEVMLDDVVEKAGKLMLASEFGGSGIATTETIRIAHQGMLNLLSELGHLPHNRLADPVKQSAMDGGGRVVCVPGPDYYLHATRTALFEPAVELGGEVHAGQALGYLHSVESMQEPPRKLAAPRSGLIFCLHGQNRVRNGDTLAVIACEFADGEGRGSSAKG